MRIYQRILVLIATQISKILPKSTFKEYQFGPQWHKLSQKLPIPQGPLNLYARDYLEIDVSGLSHARNIDDYGVVQPSAEGFYSKISPWMPNRTKEFSFDANLTDCLGVHTTVDQDRNHFVTVCNSSLLVLINTTELLTELGQTQRYEKYEHFGLADFSGSQGTQRVLDLGSGLSCLWLKYSSHLETLFVSCITQSPTNSSKPTSAQNYTLFAIEIPSLTITDSTMITQDPTNKKVLTNSHLSLSTTGYNIDTKNNPSAFVTFSNLNETFSQWVSYYSNQKLSQPIFIESANLENLLTPSTEIYRYLVSENVLVVVSRNASTSHNTIEMSFNFGIQICKLNATALSYICFANQYLAFGNLSDNHPGLQAMANPDDSTQLYLTSEKAVGFLWFRNDATEIAEPFVVEISPYLSQIYSVGYYSNSDFYIIGYDEVKNMMSLKLIPLQNNCSVVFPLPGLPNLANAVSFLRGRSRVYTDMQFFSVDATGLDGRSKYVLRYNNQVINPHLRLGVEILSSLTAPKTVNYTIFVGHDRTLKEDLFTIQVMFTPKFFEILEFDLISNITGYTGAEVSIPVYSSEISGNAPYFRVSLTLSSSDDLKNRKHPKLGGNLKQGTTDYPKPIEANIRYVNEATVVLDQEITNRISKTNIMYLGQNMFVFSDMNPRTGNKGLVFMNCQSPQEVRTQVQNCTFTFEFLSSQLPQDHHLVQAKFLEGTVILLLNYNVSSGTQGQVTSKSRILISDTSGTVLRQTDIDGRILSAAIGIDNDQQHLRVIFILLEPGSTLDSASLYQAFISADVLGETRKGSNNREFDQKSGNFGDLMILKGKFTQPIEICPQEVRSTGDVIELVTVHSICSYQQQEPPSPPSPSPSQASSSSSTPLPSTSQSSSTTTFQDPLDSLESTKTTYRHKIFYLSTSIKSQYFYLLDEIIIEDQVLFYCATSQMLHVVVQTPDLRHGLISSGIAMSQSLRAFYTYPLQSYQNISKISDLVCNLDQNVIHILAQSNQTLPNNQTITNTFLVNIDEDTLANVNRRIHSIIKVTQGVRSMVSQSLPDVESCMVLTSSEDGSTLQSFEVYIEGPYIDINTLTITNKTSFVVGLMMYNTYAFPYPSVVRSIQLNLINPIVNSSMKLRNKNHKKIEIFPIPKNVTNKSKYKRFYPLRGKINFTGTVHQLKYNPYQKNAYGKIYINQRLMYQQETMMNGFTDSYISMKFYNRDYLALASQTTVTLLQFSQGAYLPVGPLIQSDQVVMIDLVDLSGKNDILLLAAHVFQGQSRFSALYKRSNDSVWIVNTFNNSGHKLPLQHISIVSFDTDLDRTFAYVSYSRLNGYEMYVQVIRPLDTGSLEFCSFMYLPLDGMVEQSEAVVIQDTLVIVQLYGGRRSIRFIAYDYSGYNFQVSFLGEAKVDMHEALTTNFKQSRLKCQIRYAPDQYDPNYIRCVIALKGPSSFLVDFFLNFGNCDVGNCTNFVTGFQVYTSFWNPPNFTPYSLDFQNSTLMITYYRSNIFGLPLISGPLASPFMVAVYQINSHRSPAYSFLTSEDLKVYNQDLPTMSPSLVNLGNKTHLKMNIYINVGDRYGLPYIRRWSVGILGLVVTNPALVDPVNDTLDLKSFTNNFPEYYKMSDFFINNATPPNGSNPSSSSNPGPSNSSSHPSSSKTPSSSQTSGGSSSNSSSSSSSPSGSYSHVTIILFFFVLLIIVIGVVAYYYFFKEVDLEAGMGNPGDMTDSTNMYDYSINQPIHEVMNPDSNESVDGDKREFVYKRDTSFGEDLQRFKYYNSMQDSESDLSLSRTRSHQRTPEEKSSKDLSPVPLVTEAILEDAILEETLSKEGSRILE